MKSDDISQKHFIQHFGIKKDINASNHATQKYFHCCIQHNINKTHEQFEREMLLPKNYFFLYKIIITLTSKNALFIA